jgi:cAMP-dependent protein kinase regulator
MRTGPADLPGGAPAASPIDQALALLLKGEHDAALRWAAAAVAHGPRVASGLLVCGRLLSDAGRAPEAREALGLCLDTAIDAGNLPLAVAACSDLRKLGADPLPTYGKIAKAFCSGSAPVADRANEPPQLPSLQPVRPLDAALSGAALLERTAQIIAEARDGRGTEARVSPLRSVTQPLFSELTATALLELVAIFEVTTVPEGAVIIEEGTEGAEAYILARGQLEARKSVRQGEPIVLSRLAAGALFGEMALLSRAPRAASVVACRPSIVLVARKEALEALADKHPEIGASLARHCRRRMIQNLVRTSAILRAVKPEARPALIERFVTRSFEPGDKLISENESSTGLFMIASGGVSVVRHDESGPLVLSTLGPGDIVGEVSLVLRKPSTATVIAQHPTLALHLPREAFLEIIREHPSVLTELYELAVTRDEETSSIVAQEAVDVDDALLV